MRFRLTTCVVVASGAARWANQKRTPEVIAMLMAEPTAPVYPSMSAKVRIARLPTKSTAEQMSSALLALLRSAHLVPMRRA
ncbi:hypothetical protein DO944_13525 [Microbacterium sp. SMR1]|nr:hypothetical protein DO944_13525 [Microbacterium sp. SMR1]